MTPDDDQDRFASMGEHIASLLRTADEAAHRVEADAGKVAEARTAEAETKAAAVVAEAETRAAALVAAAETKATATQADAEKQARGVLDDARALLDKARDRGQQIRREADAYAEARRVEYAALIAQATQDRDQAAVVIAESRRVLGEGEQELGERIDHATQSLSKLTQMHRALSELEHDHAQLQDIGQDSAAPAAGGDEGPTGDDDGAVIDLTDTDEPAPDTAAGAEAEATADDQLDDAIGQAKSRLGDDPSPKEEAAADG